MIKRLLNLYQKLLNKILLAELKNLEVLYNNQQIITMNQNKFLENILMLYSRAKRVSLLARDNQGEQLVHIFSVIELLPLEILDYTIPTSGWYNNELIEAKNSSKKDNYNFILVVDDLSLEDALAIFKNPIQNNQINKMQSVFFNETFIQEPSGDSPLIIPSNVFMNEGLGSILPKRDSGLFVWSKIDDKRKVESMFRSDIMSKDMKAMSQLTSQWLGFDIWHKPEHIGNIYLSAPNPYFRDLDLTLSQNPSGIFYKFKLRKDITEKFKVRIVDTHGGNIALDKVYDIEDSIGLIKLPHEPHSTELRVYNSFDDLLYITGPFVFLKQISFDMNIKQADLRVKINDTKGNKEFVVEKYSGDGRSIDVGKANDFNAPYYFKRAEDSRKHIENRKYNNFVFFKSLNGNQQEANKQKEEAKALIRELINKAKYKCYICDPYFNQSDLIDYAFYITNTSVELKVLNSNGSFEKSKAQALLDTLKTYNEKPFQKIEIRTLKSGVLHDRFVVADNDVWFIGTSLNDIGSKATCIGRVPESDNIEIIKEIEKWFLNKGGNYSQSLEEYANSSVQ